MRAGEGKENENKEIHPSAERGTLTERFLCSAGQLSSEQTHDRSRTLRLFPSPSFCGPGIEQEMGSCPTRRPVCLRLIRLLAVRPLQTPVPLHRRCGRLY